MRFAFVLLSILTIPLILLGQEPQESETSFGKITIQINSGEKKSFNIKNAILYENAGVDFDTTVQIQDDENTEVLYYPQIVIGKEEILRLIIESSEDNFYDVIFNLGDSLRQRIVFENDSGKVFFEKGGKLTNFKQYAKNLNGRILTLEPTKEKIISGELNTTFDLPLDADATQFSTISLKGTFDVYFGEFRSVSLTTGPPLQKRKKNYMRNVVIAMMMAAIGFFVFLGQ